MNSVQTSHFMEWLVGLVCDQAKRWPWMCSLAISCSSLCFLFKPPSGPGRFCCCGGRGAVGWWALAFPGRLAREALRGLRSRGGASSPASMAQARPAKKWEISSASSSSCATWASCWRHEIPAAASLQAWSARLFRRTRQWFASPYRSLYSGAGRCEGCQVMLRRCLSSHTSSQMLA